MNEERWVVSTDDGPMTTFGWYPDGDGPFPIVVCYHAGPGLGEEIYSTAKRFASEGYFAVVPDLYHRHGETISFDRSELAKGPETAEFGRLIKTILSTTPEMMASDTAAVLEHLGDEAAASDGPAGCIGFCHTSRAVIEVMATMPERFIVGAIMHPAQTVTDKPDSPHKRVEKISGSIYAGFGSDDMIAPLEQQQPLIDELEKLGSSSVVDIHPRGGHGFLHPGTPAYDEQASRDSWAHTLELFRRELGAAAPA